LLLRALAPHQHGAVARVLVAALAWARARGDLLRGPGGPGLRHVPVLATFFTVRRGRDPFFKFFMQKLFPKQVDRYEKDFGMRFLGWYNVAYGWDFDNVILLELPDYETVDKLEGDPRSRAIGHRAGEWMFERHHAMFLRERMGPDLEFHP